jgi:hypothetical protein
MFIVALFKIAKSWNQPRHPAMDEQIKKTWNMYAMDYYLPIKKNEIMFTGKWMEREFIIVSEISQTQKDKYCVFFLICGI